jgi:DNA-binding transcriptional ArsR family regulator
MDARTAKTQLFDAIGELGKAFASPRRLELIDLLAQGARSVDELAKASGLSVANASQHLQALHAAGVVIRRREGTRVRYALAGDDVLELWIALRGTARARLADV